MDESAGSIILTLPVDSGKSSTTSALLHCLATRFSEVTGPSAKRSTNGDSLSLFPWDAIGKIIYGCHDLIH